MPPSTTDLLEQAHRDLTRPHATDREIAATLLGARQALHEASPAQRDRILVLGLRLLARVVPPPVVARALDHHGVEEAPFKLAEWVLDTSDE